MSEEIDLDECCGSGCTNCILDRKPVVNSKLPNIFNRTYQCFECTEIHPVTENVYRFKFKYTEEFDTSVQLMVPPGGHLMLRTLKDQPLIRQYNDIFATWRETHMALAPQATTRVIVKHDKNEEDLYISRPYTPIRVDRESASFEILVKLEPGGQMSDRLQTLTIGSRTEWKGVYGDFTWSRNERKRLLGFVQGVGIAPVYTLMRAILDDEEDETRVQLCGCFKDLRNVLLRDELREMAGYWNFRHSIYLSREECTCEKGRTEVCACFRTRLKFNEPIYNHRLARIDVENLLLTLGTDSLRVVVCGSEVFTNFIKTSLSELGIEDLYLF